jgi:hypothetical protein
MVGTLIWSACQAIKNSMKKTSDIRTKVICSKLSPKEFEIVHRRFARTTCRTVGEFIRHVLLAEPVTFNERNQSLDELLWELTRLRTDLLRIVADWEMTCKIQPVNASELPDWADRQEADRKRLLTQVELIKTFITQTAQRWLLS